MAAAWGSTWTATGGVTVAEPSTDRQARIVKELHYLQTTYWELQHVRQQQEVTVELLRSWGVSWGVIGAELQVSRQAARQRFAGLTLGAES